jgi:hypothetical protein
MNVYGNLDPGGYSLLLHAWSGIDRGLVWLRLTPFLFFLLTIAVLGRHAWELTGSRTAALLGCFIPLGYSQFLFFAFEIRAYSMEVAGVVTAGYLVHRVIRAPGPGVHLGLGVVCAIFLWSRYSFAVVVAAVVLALAIVRLRRLGPLRDEVRNLAGLLVPIVISGATMYHVTLRHHLATLRGTAPGYVHAWVLRGQPASGVVDIVRENLVSVPAFPITLAVAGLAAWPIVRRWPSMQHWPNALSYLAVVTVALLAQLMSAALSVKGTYPWYFGEKWSLYLHGTSMLCLLYLGAAAWWGARSWRHDRLVIVLVLVEAAALGARAANFHRAHTHDLVAALERLNTMSPAAGSVLVTHYEIPTVRYLYELGPFRGNGRYPAAFRFESRIEATARSPIDAAEECLEYVVSPAPLDVLGARLPGARLTPVPETKPPYLIAIDPTRPRPPHCRERRSAGPAR